MATHRMPPLLFWAAILVVFIFTFHLSRGLENSPDASSTATATTDVNNDGNNSDHDQQLDQGHLKPFGDSGSRSPVSEILGFPAKFFKDYFKTLTPVLIRGAAKLSSAFTKWTDANLRKLGSEESNAQVLLAVETTKKEVRYQDIKEMTLVEFLDVYNKTSLYVVDDVPAFLQPDLLMPCPIQCKDLEVIPLAKTMWFSSGGTQSVVHTDSYDNINCLFRGKKSIVLIDPSTISRGSIIDRPGGTFSALDVDRVDLEKYPTLRGARFLEAHMEEGDCLYIPYLWIHQVRSFDSNLAVNFWWDRFEALDILDSDHCPEDDHHTCDLQSTVDHWLHPPLSEDNFTSKLDLRPTKDHMTALFEYSFYHVDRLSDFDVKSPRHNEKVKVDVFVDTLENNVVSAGDDAPPDFVRDVRARLREIVTSLDGDNDGVVTKEEYVVGKDGAWEEMSRLLVDFYGLDDKPSSGDDAGEEGNEEEVTRSDESEDGEKSLDKDEL